MASPDSSNHQETETAPSQPPEPPSKESWIGRHSTEIQAFAAVGILTTTIVLAVFAYFSWSEVQKQRGLAFKQFIVANAPSVRAYVNKRFEFQNDRAIMIWQAVNKGGPVDDVEFKSVILCCSPDDIANPESTRVVIRTTKEQKLNRGDGVNVAVEVKEPKTLEWLKSAVSDETAKLFVYVQAKYTIPEELSLEGSAEDDKVFRISIWDAGANRFENIELKTQELLLRLIEERGYLKMDDRG